MRLSIVIPAYNEESRLPGALDRLLAALEGRDAQIVVVDDGSADRTAELAARRPVKLVRLPVNGGRGAAVRAGVEAADGDLVLEMDADASVELEAVGRFVDHFARHPGVDVLIGSRNADGARMNVPQSFLRVFLGYCFLYASKALFGWDITDYTLGFKMFRRDAARDVFAHQRDSDYVAEAELVVAARERGWRLQELPVSWTELGGSRVRVWRDSWRSLAGLARLLARRAAGAYAPDPGRLSYPAARRRVIELYGGRGWASLFTRIRFFTAPYASLEPLVPRRGLVVDLGCGYGTFSHLLGLLGPERRVVGLDLDAGKVSHAARGLSNVDCRVGDVRTAALEPADCVLLVHVLHHLDSYEAQERLLDVCVERLKPGGRLIVCEVDGEPRWKHALGLLADRLLYPGEPIHYRFLGPMTALLESKGLRVEARRSDAGTPFAHVTYACERLSAAR